MEERKEGWMDGKKERKERMKGMKNKERMTEREEGIKK